ncbi:pyruvate, water dikinase regulatory protein [Nitrosomonas sp. Is37]|uniref:posphoenolpyruvate synthetase regulatory kinase/phosphorylase PpsR n=1 Tax=Nitrosomonas sp. Is37 TaxID=3080535 RepID=UPI00294ACA8B|nr:pyruvate, water dikinase regulatory protein [Nitrosomonas sp. Is37]MDV6343214.1 pyruvate, water dikinase regulatory protein [Nitrosomonas sp. Is37]
MTKQKRTVFYLSDRTGITAETLGHSLLTQFDGIEWKKINVPFLDNMAKARTLVERINHAAECDGYRPLVFSTLLKADILEVIRQANCRVYDFFETFISSIEQELQQPSARMAGRSHGLQQPLSYFKRIAAINYALGHDDGVNPKNFTDADIILVGVSRAGKTPTCLYLALQYGIAAANYPLTQEDMLANQLPKVLEPVRNKLFGLTLSAAQLHFIREERRPHSQYASLAQCQREIQWQESLFQLFHIPYLDTTHISIEEISAIILDRSGLKRQLYG